MHVNILGKCQFCWKRLSRVIVKYAIASDVRLQIDLFGVTGCHYFQYRYKKIEFKANETYSPDIVMMRLFGFGLI